MVAIELGGCLASLSLVRPGNPTMKFLCSALASVGIVDLNRLAWLKATR